MAASPRQTFPYVPKLFETPMQMDGPDIILQRALRGGWLGQRHGQLGSYAMTFGLPSTYAMLSPLWYPARRARGLWGGAVSPPPNDQVPIRPVGDSPWDPGWTYGAPGGVHVTRA